MSKIDISKIDEWQIHDLLDRTSAEELRMTLVNEIKRLRCFLVELRKCNYINNEESKKFLDLILLLQDKEYRLYHMLMDKDLHFFGDDFKDESIYPF